MAKKIALKGFKRITLHPIEEDSETAYTVGEKVRLPAAQTLSKEDQRTESQIFADDVVYDSTSDLQGTQLTLGVAELSTEHEALLEGAEYTEEDKHAIYKLTDVRPEYSFGYMAPMSSGGVRCFRHFVVKLTQITVNHETKGVSNDIAPYELVFFSTARKYDSSYREQQDFEDQEAGAAWLDAVKNMPESADQEL